MGAKLVTVEGPSGGTRQPTAPHKKVSAEGHSLRQQTFTLCFSTIRLPVDNHVQPQSDPSPTVQATPRHTTHPRHKPIQHSKWPKQQSSRKSVHLSSHPCYEPHLTSPQKPPPTPAPHAAPPRPPSPSPSPHARALPPPSPQKPNRTSSPPRTPAYERRTPK